MTDESTSNTDSARTQDSRTQSSGSSSGTSQPKTTGQPSSTSKSNTTGNTGKSNLPSSNPTIGDPARRDIGDRTEEASKRAEASKAGDKAVKSSETRSDGKNDTDAGEGHKGPRVDATRGSTDSQATGQQSTSQQNKPTQANPASQPSQGNQPKQGNQPNPKSSPVNAPAKSGGECSTGMGSESKSNRNQGGTTGV